MIYDMRRVLWGSQHIGEATPGLLKSKKAKQKVKECQELFIFQAKIITIVQIVKFLLPDCFPALTKQLFR